ncbi:MAG: hypothetical protein DHS20C18_07730 [Saprospiraceae bacterium]|nr:MAG: hypothetical protein DHS20C18_07730 [Saprospiraceae bacterium]
MLLFTMPPAGVLSGIIAIIFLLVCSGLISGSEVAFFSLTHNDFEKLAQENNKTSQRILKMKDLPRKLLATILITNNFINIAIVLISDSVLNQILPPETYTYWAQQLINLLDLENWMEVETTARNISFAINVVGVTFLLVLFGEVAPKVYARLNNIGLAKVVSKPLFILMDLFSPASMILVNWTKIIERRLAKTKTGVLFTSREDIDEAIDLTVTSDQVNAHEIDILKSIVKFGDVSVTQIMRSRMDIIAFDFRGGFQDLLTLVKESGLSRIPVYETDFDNITGILYVKDLLGKLQHGPDFEWQSLIRTNVLFVPEAKKIDDLLREFQKQHLHMAIVVDEYGGTSGLVTLEDIMEEIIGDIQDEFDDEAEVDYQKIDDFNFIFDGKTLLNDVCRQVGLDTSTFDPVKGESDSLAGMVLEILGRLPREGEEIGYNDFKFKVVKVTNRRIEQILITLPR